MSGCTAQHTLSAHILPTFCACPHAQQQTQALPATTPALVQDPITDEQEGPLSSTLATLTRLAADDHQLSSALVALGRLNRPAPPRPAPPSEWDEAEPEGPLDPSWGPSWGPSWLMEGRAVQRDTAMGLLYSVAYLEGQQGAGGTTRVVVGSSPRPPTAPGLLQLLQDEQLLEEQLAKEEDVDDDATEQQGGASPGAAVARARIASASKKVGSAVDGLLRYAGDDVVLRGGEGGGRRLQASPGGVGEQPTQPTRGVQWVRMRC